MRYKPNRKSEQEQKVEEQVPVEGIVTMIERHPKKYNRYLVHVEGELAYTLYEDVMVTYRIIKGSRIDKELAKQIIEENGRQAAWVDALAFVGRRPRALREVKLYLKRKGHSENQSAAAADRLLEQGYVDDAQFAAQMAEHRILEQNKGRRWVQQELQMKGVQREVIQEALSQVNPDEEQEAARQLASKRWHSMSGTPVDKRRKLTAYLMRRGYAGSMVNGIIRELLASATVTEEEEFWELEVENDTD